MKTTAAGIDNNLAELRQRRGLSAIQLAKMAGVSRQTIYAMENGSYVPNTAVALKLARALETSVEDLFTLSREVPQPQGRTEHVTLLPASETPEPGQPVQLCRVDRRIIGAMPSAAPWYFPPSDGIVTGKSAGHRASVQVFQAEADFANRILMAGCDPGISVLARHAQSAGVELVLAHRNSSQALMLLSEGSLHVAGTHLRDDASGESNLPEVGRRFPKDSVAVISFAVWEEGIVTARGNPKHIRGIEDLARVSIVNREPGAGSRILLDNQLKRLGIDRRKVNGYTDVAQGHLAAAWRVRSGGADCCIATRASARVFGLGFVPLLSERYDLAIRRQHLDLPGIQRLLDTLSRSAFRRELENLGGYDASRAGQRLL